MTGGQEWLRELEGLQAEGEKLQRAAQARQLEINELLGITEHGAVTVTFDEKGLMSSVEFDPELRKGLTPEKLLQEINSGIARASGMFGAPAATTTVPGTDEDAAESASSMLDQLTKVLSSGSMPEAKEVVNDFKTVTVTALWGNITRVDCDLRWIGSTPDHLIAEEVVRISRIAALESDTFGRFDERNSR